jgi:hypothetical protein
VYEYTVLLALARLGFALERVGGKDDAGIDLQGRWRLPSISSSMNSIGAQAELDADYEQRDVPAIVQCKSLSRPASPSIVRELEGSLIAAPQRLYREGIGILAAPREATKGVREAMMRSKVPLAFVKVPQLESFDGLERSADEVAVVEQCIWNATAQERFLAGMGVTIRYGGMERGSGKGEVVLVWRGKILNPVKHDLDTESVIEAAEDDLDRAAQQYTGTASK